MKRVPWYGLGLLFLISSVSAITLPKHQTVIYRRTHILQSIPYRVQSALVAALSTRKEGEICCQYGQTLGDVRLRTQVAKVLASLGIKSDVGKNVAIFHDFAELYVILGELFLDPGDVVMYQGSSEDLKPLEYYGAKLKPLSFGNANAGSFEGVKLVFIEDSSGFDANTRAALLEEADEHNFIIIERNLNPQACASLLKRDDKNGRVILLDNFDQIIPGVSSIIPLIFAEASTDIMRKIEIVKGNFSLCTNQMLQGILIQMLAEKTAGVDIEFTEDVTASSVDLEALLSESGEKVVPSEIREILIYSAVKGLIYIAGGVPDPNLFPVEEFKNIAEGITEADWSEMMNSTDISGLLRLRNAYANWMNRRYGTSISADNVFVTNGSQEDLAVAIGMWAKREGRSVITESPAYLGMLGAVVPFIGEDKISHMDLRTEAGREELRRRLQEAMDRGEAPPAIYVNPDFGNPSGYLWTLEERKGLVDVVNEFRNKGYDVVIFEDNPYGCLNYTGLKEGEEKEQPPLLKSLASDAVIYLGTMSKITSPGLRIGYYVADQKYMEQFSGIMKELDLAVAALPQFITARFIETGLDEYIEMLRQAYKVKADAMQAALKKYMPEGISWEQAKGGLFFWVETPEEWELDLKKLLTEKAVTGAIGGVKFAYVPGKTFSLDGSTSNCVRLCFSTSSVEDIDRAIWALGEMFRQNMPK